MLSKWTEGVKERFFVTHNEFPFQFSRFFNFPITTSYFHLSLDTLAFSFKLWRFSLTMYRCNLKAVADTHVLQLRKKTPLKLPPKYSLSVDQHNQRACGHVDYVVYLDRSCEPRWPLYHCIFVIFIRINWKTERLCGSFSDNRVLQLIVVVIYLFANDVDKKNRVVDWNAWLTISLQIILTL